MSQPSHEFAALRNELLKNHPELRPGKKHPLQILWYVALAGPIVGISADLVHSMGQGAGLLHIAPETALLGIFWGSLGLFTHELLHGSILRVGPLVRSLAFFGFLIFGLSPSLWITWHNRVHHFHTNRSGIDPDSFGLWDYFKTLPMIDFIQKRAPGSRHLWSWIYLPLNFSNQALTVMWFMLWKGDPKLYASARRPAVIETLSQYAIWIAFFAIAGGRAGLFVLVIPALIANLVVSSYILVQHLFCPLTDSNQPLENTLGVRALPGLDRIHFNFSHHVEHHVFPEMNHADLPEVREILMKEYGDAYRILGHRRALGILMKGPRIYRDAQTLWDPASDRSLDVSKMGREN